MTEETRKTRKTIKVRIAVAVAENGWWQAEGWSRTSEREPDKVLARAAAANLMNKRTVVHFVEAEIPLPEEAQTFQGSPVGEFPAGEARR